jgi:hypothetical protein
VQLPFLQIVRAAAVRAPPVSTVFLADGAARRATDVLDG